LAGEAPAGVRRSQQLPERGGQAGCARRAGRACAPRGRQLAPRRAQRRLAALQRARQRLGALRAAQQLRLLPRDVPVSSVV